MRHTAGLAAAARVLVRLLALIALVAVPVGRGDQSHEVGSVTEAYAALTPTQVAARTCPEGRALVRLPDGELHEVSVARGLASYTGRAPGQLVLICSAD